MGSRKPSIVGVLVVAVLCLGLAGASLWFFVSQFQKSKTREPASVVLQRGSKAVEIELDLELLDKQIAASIARGSRKQLASAPTAILQGVARSLNDRRGQRRASLYDKIVNHLEENESASPVVEFLSILETKGGLAALEWLKPRKQGMLRRLEEGEETVAWLFATEIAEIECEMDLADRWYREMITANPTWAAPRHQLIDHLIYCHAMLRMGEGNYDAAIQGNKDAEQLAHSLIELQPDNWEWHRSLSSTLNMLGLACKSKKDYPAAIDYFKEAITTGKPALEANPRDPVMIFEAQGKCISLARTYAATKEPKEALKWYDEAIELGKVRAKGRGQAYQVGLRKKQKFSQDAKAEREQLIKVFGLE